LNALRAALENGNYRERLSLEVGSLAAANTGFPRRANLFIYRAALATSNTKSR